ncbi:SPOR domain-containing protein [Solimicrobium silvestre]|uniref:Sporulation related domain n=1 Tax=Solimicrobium silvestre TaxID=2099400 RepID=A0A2S9GSF3_9BURK|nr:SPOR domain-containing protein [Solimicrobium silvestre]PRC90626.1 Sporulation related domain [Solimicrobium silvestre]
MKSIVKSSMTKQHGGTLLGLIIGLVVGLAIAVVVALMITKTSTPFTNKLGMNKSADAPTVQLTDPNKPLYGNAAKAALANKPAENSVATVATPPEAVRPPDVVKLDTKPDAKIDTKADPKTTVDAKVTKPIDSTVAKNSADEKSAYYLQVGAFRDASDAESARAKLALIGVESHVSEKTAEGDNLYRVRIGPFDQLDTMNRMRSKLSENSIDVAVIKTPK